MNGPQDRAPHPHRTHLLTRPHREALPEVRIEVHGPVRNGRPRAVPVRQPYSTRPCGRSTRRPERWTVPAPGRGARTGHGRPDPSGRRTVGLTGLTGLTGRREPLGPVRGGLCLTHHPGRRRGGGAARLRGLGLGERRRPDPVDLRDSGEPVTIRNPMPCPSPSALYLEPEMTSASFGSATRHISLNRPSCGSWPHS